MKRYLLGTLVCLTLYVPVTTLLAAAKTTDEKSDIPARLGWVSLPATENICCGYYLDPLASFVNKPLPPLTTTPIAINADTGTFHQEGTSILIGQVTLAQPGRLANADRILINRPADKDAPTTADLYGNVILREPGKVVSGDSAHLELHSKAATFMHAIYRMALTAPNLVDNSKTKSDASSMSAWGKANTVHQDKQGLISLIKASYSTCAPTGNTWRMNAKKIILNRDEGRGYAYNAWLDVKDIPVFYTPYFNFPIDNRRESGFLWPTVGVSGTSGFNFTIPYYWNIAPNYDAVITPHFYTKRGLQMSTDFRYLTTNSTGHISGSFLPDDPEFTSFQDQAASKFVGNPALGRLLNSDNNRSAFSWVDNTTFNQHWNSSVNYNTVSDDYYLQDFGNIPTTANNQLLQNATVNYAGENWNFNGLLQQYQTLHPVNQAAVNNPYSDLPQLNWNGNYMQGPLGLQYLFNNQFTYFTRSPNPGEITPVPTAARINIEPGISLPITSLAGYFTPTLQLAMTHYNVGSQVPGFDSSIQRTLPIFDIDTGLYFDRDTSLFGHDYQQTLEPRLFYLYVPYRNQADIPVFDTGIIPFTYDSLFMTNRFSGLDRIGDANQIAYALTTRFFDANDNIEKFRASIGQIYYFHNRQVNLCEPGAAAGTTPSTASNFGSCNIDPAIAVGATSSTEKFSPIAGQLVYNLNPYWSASANAAWDPSNNETVNGGANIQYKPAVNHVINLNYNYIRFGDAVSVLPNQTAIPPESHLNDLNQAGVSFAWPVRDRWSAVGGYTYNISHQYPQTYFYGLQYDNCCWAVRAVVGHAFVGLNQNNNPTFNNVVYLQWQFKGLANVGNADPTAFLLGSIPGYQDNFQPLQGSSL